MASHWRFRSQGQLPPEKNQIAWTFSFQDLTSYFNQILIPCAISVANKGITDNMIN
jgi:hypothetical protein